MDPGSTVELPIRFPGQYFDAESGLHYNLHRYYDPNVGRYLSPEPVGQFGVLANSVMSPLPGSTLIRVGIGSANLYPYALNNPTSFIDPDGRWVLPAVGAALGGGSVAYNKWEAYQSGAISGSEYAQLVAAGAGTGALGAFVGGGVLGAVLYGGAAGAFTDLLDQTIEGDPCAGFDYGSAARSGAFGALGGGVAAGLQKAGGAFIDVGSPVPGAGASDYSTVGGVVGAVVGTYIGSQ